MSYALFFKNLSFYYELYTVRLGAILRPFWRREGSMAELSRAEPARDEPSRAELGRAEPARAGLTWPPLKTSPCHVVCRSLGDYPIHVYIL